MQKSLKTWAPPILWAALIFAVSSIPSLQVTEDTLLQHIINNTGHFTEYAILAALIFRSLSTKLSGQNLINWTYITSIAYAASDEIHQLYVPGRMADIKDILIDTLGIMGAVWWLTLRKSKKHKN